jgi:glyoxylase-like metal-dependent hydrolase (beta-lactamase superfamily II)
MIVLMNSGGVASTNCYLIADEQAKQAVLFDAPDGTAGRLLDEADKRGLDLIGLWLTHSHFDHIADHAVVTRRFPKARVLIHELEAPRLRDPGPQGRMFGLPFVIPAREPDGLLVDGQDLAIGSIPVRVLHTPGHAPGHVMFHLPREKVLVGGDLIIGGSVGRTDLPDSSHADLLSSICRIMKLPPDTMLLPGHGEPETLEHERQTNPYVIDALGES